MAKIPAYWRETVARLRKELPLPFPVSVRTASRIPGEKFGDVSFDGEKFRIRILRTNPWIMYFVLAHEWAHALDNWHHPEIKEHNDAWGVHLARAYRVIHEEGL